MNKIWIILPIILAIILLVVLPKFKQPPKTQQPAEKAVPVKVIKTVRLPFKPKITAYGITRPAQSWKSIAEVSGTVIWISDQLKEGNILAKGTHILSIDDKTYQLNLKQIQAQIKLLALKNQATQNILKIEQKRYNSLKNEVERKRKLLKRGTVTQSHFDEIVRNLLSLELTIQNHNNTLDLYQSELELLQVQKEQAELDIRHTKIMTPMDVRLTELNIQQYQLANKGQTLLSTDGIDQVEIEARVPIGQLRPLLASKNSAKNTLEQVERSPGAKKLKATVLLKTASHTIEWPAQVDRVSGLIDPQTQTIGVVVTINDPYKKAQPGKRPPLIRNTMVEVILEKQAAKKANQDPIIIPQSALKQGKVYVLDSENRLKIIKLKPQFKQGNLAIISKGLDEDEMIVISKLSPAIEGMLLEPIKDPKAMKQLKMEASGKEIKKSQTK